MTNRSAVLRPSAARNSHKHADQISPSSCTSPSRSLDTSCAVGAAEKGARPRVRGRVPIADGRLQFFRLTSEKKLAARKSPKALTHGSSFVSCAKARHLIVLDGVPVLVKNNFGVFGVINSAGAESQVPVRWTVMRVVVTQSINVHRNRAVDHVLETKLLKISLYSIDVKINHHFFESAIGPLEAEIVILSFTRLLVVFVVTNGPSMNPTS